jgi:hypothetical protein
MNYQVMWTRRAEGELAEIWTNSTRRELITRAARDIDAALARDPTSCGESRSTGRRVFFVRPLMDVFRISEADRLVRVIGVREYGKG